jgi:hypothetical protein
VLDSRDVREIHKTHKICRLIILLTSQHTYNLLAVLSGIYIKKYSYNEQKINKYKDLQNMRKGVSISKKE